MEKSSNISSSSSFSSSSFAFPVSLSSNSSVDPQINFKSFSLLENLDSKFGFLFSIEKIERKSRGFIATQRIEKGKTILEDLPILSGIQSVFKIFDIYFKKF